MPDLPRWRPLHLLHEVVAVSSHGRRIVSTLDDGRVLHSRDGGATWTQAFELPAGAALTVLAGPDTDWIGTTAGVFRAAAHEGWAPRQVSPPDVVVTSLAATGQTVLAGTLRTGVWRSPDGGVQWTPCPHGLPLEGARLRIFSLAASPCGLVAAHALGVSLSRDGGASWHPATLGLPLRLPFATLSCDGTQLYAGAAGHLFRAAHSSEADGLSWAEIHDGAARPLGLLAAAAGSLFAAVGGEPFLLTSADEGASWQSVASGLPEPPGALAVAPCWLVALLGDGRLWRAPLLPAEHHERCLLDLYVQQGTAATALAFVLPCPAATLLTIHDVLGAEVARLAEGELGAGAHRVLLPSGMLPPGLYQCRLRADSVSRSAPLVMTG